MIQSVQASTTAIHAFQKKMDVTANNIANVNTDGFKKSRTNLMENPNGGVQARVQKIETPGVPKEAVKNGSVVEVSSSNVDLAEELTETIPSQAGYNANLKTLKVADEMLGSLLDIVG